MAINDTKKNVLLGQSVEEQVKNIDDNFTSLFDTVDDLNDGINTSGFITKDVDNLTNYTVKTETGTDIELSLNTTNYTMTLNLKNAAGTIVSTDTIDFPIESMVVNATYASGTLTLTLQNGTTLDVDISAIISGLVPDTRTINGKQLNANVTLTQDDVGDGTTYKRFSQIEKTKLSGIAEGANKYTHPSYTARTKGLYKITVDATGHVSEVEEVGVASTTADGLMSKTDKEKLEAIDDSLKNVTADQIGKVKDVKVNGTSVLGTDGIAAITIADLEADFVSVATTDSVWKTNGIMVNGTTYQAIRVEKTDSALGVFNSAGQEIIVQKVVAKENNVDYLYLCVGTAKVACTIRKLSGGAVGSGGGSGSGDVTAAGNNTFTGTNNFTKQVTFGGGNGIAVTGQSGTVEYRDVAIIRNSASGVQTDYLAIPYNKGTTTLATLKDLPAAVVANPSDTSGAGNLDALKVGNDVFLIREIPKYYNHCLEIKITVPDSNTKCIIITAQTTSRYSLEVDSLEKLRALFNSTTAEIVATGIASDILARTVQSDPSEATVVGLTSSSVYLCYYSAASGNKGMAVRRSVPFEDNWEFNFYDFVRELRAV